jgi:hypothetical protein
MRRFAASNSKYHRDEPRQYQNAKGDEPSDALNKTNK